MVHIKRNEDTLIVNEFPRRFNIETSEEIYKEIFKNISSDVKIILDFSGCEFIDSTGFTRLVELLRRCYGEETHLIICNISQDLFELFEVTHLDKVFEIIEDVEKALEKLRIKKLV